MSIPPGGVRGLLGQWDWRRALRLPAAAPVRVVASTRLDARASLHVLEWEGSRLLIGRSETAITLLAQRPVAATPMADEGAAAEPPPT